jgi:hypothetical protein
MKINTGMSRDRLSVLLSAKSEKSTSLNAKLKNRTFKTIVNKYKKAICSLNLSDMFAMINRFKQISKLKPA